MVRKELIELRHDPRLFGLVIMAPIIQLTMLGYAATTDVRDVPMVVVDQDRSAASRDLVSRFDASQNFVVVEGLPSLDDVEPYLDEGRAWMALAIPADYGAHLMQGEPVTVQVIADGSDASSTNVALGYAGSLIAGDLKRLTANDRRLRILRRGPRSTSRGGP